MSTSGASEGHEQSFAEVLNSLNDIPSRSPRHRERIEEPPSEQFVIPWLATSRPQGESGNVGSWNPDGNSGWGTAAQWSAGPEEWGEPEDFTSAVRPYTWTRGRTRPVYDLAVEALVSTTAQGRDIAALTSVEHRAVAELCRGPRSVAEVAALLALPLGVVRVLLGDMADSGLVMVHRTATSSGKVPGFGFMERVLSGLRRL